MKKIQIRSLTWLNCCLSAIVIITSCAGGVHPKHEYRIAHPKLSDYIKDSTGTLAFYPLIQSSFWISDSCPAPDTSKTNNQLDTNPQGSKTHDALSKDAFEFELNNVVDSLFREVWPKPERTVLIPGVGIPESDSLGDSLALSLRKLPLNIKDVELRKSATISYDEKIPPDLKMAIARFKVRYKFDYLLIPVDAQLKVWPSSPCSRNGEYQVKILLALWDGKAEKLLYLRYQDYSAKVGGEGDNLNSGWTRYFVKQLAEDLQKILLGVQE